MLLLAPVSLDVVELNRKIDALNGNFDGVDYRSIYPEDVYLILTNQVLRSKWDFHVVSKVTFEGEDEELYCTTCECEYSMNQPMLFKQAADILMDELKILLKEELHGLHPDSIIVTGSGKLTLGTKNVSSSTKRSRSKNRRKR